jgi:Nitroreductase family
MDFPMIKHILELARWAPSGDNEQPWRFEILGDQKVRIHGFDTRDQVLYDYRGRPSYIAHGALLETLRIAATGSGFRAQWSLVDASDERRPLFDVQLTPDESIQRDPLFSHIEGRTVQRRPMKTASLSDVQRQALIDAAGPNFQLQFLSANTQRRAVARLLWHSAHSPHLS